MRIFWLFLAAICLFSEEKITTHTIEFNGAPLHYTATVAKEGPVSYISYVKNPQENRPITFVFNGGPGSSSCWLHLGAFGPRRLISPEEGGSALPPYSLVDNLETLLDVTDLVFIDPSDTGFSESKEEYFDVIEDIRSVGLLIRDYLTEHQRWNSPKYIAGESYGGLRGAGVANLLSQEFSIYLNGLILISPALDFQCLLFGKNSPLPYLLFVPTYATAAWYHSKAHEGLTLEAVAQKAREFAYGPYAQALLCPKCKNMQSLYPDLCAMIGLSEDRIYRLEGKISDMTFVAELLGNERKMIGRMDARVSGVFSPTFLDPGVYQIDGIFAGALHDYLHKELQFQESYALFSNQANDKWNYSNVSFGYPNMMKELANTLICNSSMKLFVGCGYFDLATPFASVEYCIDHIGVPNISTQVEYYEGGHMYYLNPSARIKFKQDLLRFYEKN